MITKYLAIIRTNAKLEPMYGGTAHGQTWRCWQFPRLRLYIRVGELK